MPDPIRDQLAEDEREAMQLEALSHGYLMDDISAAAAAAQPTGGTRDLLALARIVHGEDEDTTTGRHGRARLKESTMRKIIVAAVTALAVLAPTTALEAPQAVVQMTP